MMELFTFIAMKTSIHSLLIFACALIMTVSSCKKEEDTPPTSTGTPDQTPPVITINGGNYQTQMEPAVAGTGTWTNPSATAMDAVAGDVSASIVITGTVDPNTVGVDTLYYTASDAVGNTNTDTLIVEITPYVFHVAAYLAGSYNANDTCQVSGAFNYNSTWTTSTTVNNQVNINNFGAFGSSINVTATVDAVQQTISFAGGQTLAGAATLTSASGSYTHNGNSVDVDIVYIWTDGTSSESCVSHYNK